MRLSGVQVFHEIRLAGTAGNSIILFTSVKSWHRVRKRREYPRHVILDEAQECPDLFRQLRGIVDQNRRETGRFILTGSSSPELLKQASDSLAGRIAIVELGALTPFVIDVLLPCCHHFPARSLTRHNWDAQSTYVKMPKGIIRDSGLNHYLAGIDTRDKLLRAPQVGHNFESFVIEELIKGIQATQVTRWDYFYYRTKNRVELDLILVGSFGILPVEIKFGQQTTRQQIRPLQQFVQQHDLPFGMVINNSNQVCMLSDRIIQIPAGCV